MSGLMARVVMCCAAAMWLAACGADPTEGASGDGSGATSDAAADVEAQADASADTTGPLDAGADAADASPTDVAPDITDDIDAADDADGDGADLDSTELDDAEAALDADAGAPDVRPPGCPSGDGLARFGDELSADALWHDVTLFACARNAHVFVAPRGASFSVYGEALPPGTRIVVRGAHYFASIDGGVAPTPLGVSAPANGGGFTEVSFSPDFSGEHIVTIERDRRVDAVDARIMVRCDSGCDRRATRFPIVLVHGYAGVDSYFGVLDYFYDIYDRMTSAGYAVYRPTTAPIATSVQRANELAPQIDAILAETGARQINMIGHSQGGLDARVLISGMGYADRVASVTTVSTPHHGIPLLLVDFASVMDFSPENMVTFNLAYPDAEGVRYWSWSARTCGLLDFGCQRDSDGETVDVLFAATHLLLSRFGENDGLVPSESAIWGEHLGLIFADHMDSVGQIADPVRGDDPFDHRAFYMNEARRLADAGF